MKIIDVKSPGLTLDSIIALIPKTEGILFVGAGSDSMPAELSKKGYKILCNDLKPKPFCYNLGWIQGDVLNLDYNNLSKEYRGLVSRNLCSHDSGKLVLDCIESYKWVNFDYVAIEFCHTTSCYSSGNDDKLKVAARSEQFFSENGFNTAIYNGGKKDMDLMVIAAKNSSIPYHWKLFPFGSKKEYKKNLKKNFETMVMESFMKVIGP